MTNSDYDLAMAKAKELENLIARYKSGDDAAKSKIFQQNWVSKTKTSFLEFEQAYKNLFEIYKRFNQHNQARSLLDNLFEFVDNCDEFSYLTGLRLLLVVGNEIDWLSSWKHDVSQLVKARLKNLIGQTIFYHFEPSFWIIAAKRATDLNNRSALELLRDLSDEGEEKANVDRQLCRVMELAARFNLAYPNLPMAEQWFRWAAEIAQNRLADRNLSGQFLERASQIHRMHSQQPPSEAYLQAIRAEVNTPEYAAAIRQLNVVESLDVIMQKEVEKQHQQRFLAPLEQIMKEYESTSNILETLASDMRFTLDLDQIKAKSKSEQNGLTAWLSGVDIDARDNPRQDMSPRESIEHRFTLQALYEIYEAIVNIVYLGTKSVGLTNDEILAYISKSKFKYDWTIYKVGLERFSNKDFISSSHILVTQFENIFREMLRVNGIPVKRNVGGVSGDLPLNALIEDTAVRNLVGFELAETIDWFLTRSYGPFGYRHKIAHGWISPRECNFELCCLAIWLTLVALRYVTYPAQDTDVDNQTQSN